MSSSDRARRLQLFRRRAGARRPAPGPAPAVPPGSAAGRRRSSSGCGQGEIAVIDHADLDRLAAEDLVASDVAAVVNVAPFSTGRYPNGGPLLLARAGVRLVEVPAAPLFEELRDGDVIELSGGEVRLDGSVLASGQELTVATLEERLDDAAGEDRRGALRVRREHDRARPRRGRAAARRAGPAGDTDRVPRPPRADRRARDHLPQGPANAAGLHRRRAPGAGGGRRRRRRHPRGGLRRRT